MGQVDCDEDGKVYWNGNPIGESIPYTFKGNRPKLFFTPVKGDTGPPGPPGPPGDMPPEFMANVRRLTRRVAELETELELLKKNKLDKPSASQELKAAEQYIDDYLRSCSKGRRDAFKRTQRIKKKLNRAKEQEKHSSGEELFIVGIFSLLTILIMFFVLIMTL